MKRRTAPFTNIRRERVSADYGDKLVVEHAFACMGSSFCSTS
jgi:hypothetical protein